MPRYDPRRHHRRSIRLKGYDYSQPGAYFVTMVARQREHLFGEILLCTGEASAGSTIEPTESGVADASPQRIKLTTVGEIVLKAWQKIPAHFPFTRLDEFVIMPNHFHGIIWISTGEAFTTGNYSQVEQVPVNASPHHPIGTQPGSLNAIIQNFKSISTRKINQARNTPGNKIWQRDYYERIIRNDQELNAIRQYIRENPFNWPQDQEYR